MSETMAILQPPALEIDARLGQPRAMGKLERRVVWNLLHHLQAAGFQLVRIFDGEEDVACRNPKDAMELVFNLDAAHVYFQKGVQREHWVFLVMGNGVDVVSDWTYCERDRDGFYAAMEAFDGEAYA